MKNCRKKIKLEEREKSWEFILFLVTQFVEKGNNSLEIAEKKWNLCD